LCQRIYFWRANIFYLPGNFFNIPAQKNNLCQRIYFERGNIFVLPGNFFNIPGQINNLCQQIYFGKGSARDSISQREAISGTRFMERINLLICDNMGCVFATRCFLFDIVCYLFTIGIPFLDTPPALISIVLHHALL